ncbi:MAG: anti-sigma regulatory factor [Bacteroidetes bacterium]|jgi:anti-sigma regulatory factor (Ser/Thr protein kinase)|nr:anti-sigma regulatory factor [Bacteroidota bacterium]
MQLTYEIAGGDFGKAGYASSEIKKVLKKLNLDLRIIKKIAVALYEAEVNIVAHAYRGSLTVEIDTVKISVKAQDEGPGIADIDQAMTEGFSTASAQVREMGFGAGMGLPNIKKNADELNISSEVGKGTELEIITYLK